MGETISPAKKKISPFRRGFLDQVKSHQREYHDKLWDLILDVYTKMFIIQANQGEGGEILRINLTLDEEDNVIEYDLKSPEKAWDAIKEKLYTDYLQLHVGTHLYRDAILAEARKTIESRIPFIIKLLQEKP